MVDIDSMGKQMNGFLGIHQSDWKRQTMKVMNDPIVMRWIQEHPELTEVELRTNVTRLYQYAKEKRQCDQCPGLEQCPNDLLGHFTKISVHPEPGQLKLVDYKAPCNLYQMKAAQEALRSRIRSFYVDEKALRHEYAIDEIVSRDLERAESVEAILEYILIARSGKLPLRGLYLVGDFGTGKTFLASYLLYELAKSGYTGVIVYMPDFVEELKSMFGDPLRMKETIDMLKETDLLVFDDIGAEHLNAWTRDHVLGTILNYRMNRKPTFYTSNQDLEQLHRHFSFTSKEGEDRYRGERIMDRIRPFVDVIEIGGKNQRGSNKQ
jgi:primosomal protein DnaI